MVNQREVTEDNLEKNFATNTLGKTQTLYCVLLKWIASHIGTYVLTTELFPAFERSKFHPRVVSLKVGSLILLVVANFNSKLWY